MPGLEFIEVAAVTAVIIAVTGWLAHKARGAMRPSGARLPAQVGTITALYGRNWQPMPNCLCGQDAPVHHVVKTEFQGKVARFCVSGEQYAMLKVGDPVEVNVR